MFTVSYTWTVLVQVQVVKLVSESGLWNLLPLKTLLEDAARDVRNALALWLTIGPGMLRESSCHPSSRRALAKTLASLKQNILFYTPKTNGMTASTAIHYFQNQASLRGDRKNKSDSDVFVFCSELEFWFVYLLVVCQREAMVARIFLERALRVCVRAR